MVPNFSRNTSFKNKTKTGSSKISLQFIHAATTYIIYEIFGPYRRYNIDVGDALTSQT